MLPSPSPEGERIPSSPEDVVEPGATVLSDSETQVVSWRAIVQEKVKEWIKRYLPAEVFGTTTALAGGLSAHYLSNGHPIVTGYASAMSENVGYYGLMIVREMRNNVRSGQRPLGAVVKTARDLTAEFGPAEALDSLLVRPLCIAQGTQVAGEHCTTGGILGGKFAADVVFSALVIASYEIRKKIFQSIDDKDSSVSKD